MHNNYYFLRQLSQSLKSVLTDTVISECFSQNKDELILRFETHTVPFYIKASLQPSFSCLSFPEEFHRARKNSVDLFSKLIGTRVEGMRQFENERSFAFILNHDLTLLFKMHGNRSNVILFENNQPLELFKKNIPADATLNPETLDRVIDSSFEAFSLHQHKLSSLYFTFGKVVWAYLETLHFNTEPLEKRWNLIQQVLHELNNPSFFITQVEQTLHLSLLKLGNVQKEMNDPIPALNAFFYAYTYGFTFDKEKASMLSTLRAKLHSSENYYHKNFNKLLQTQNDTNYKMWADLIMANLHTIKTGTEKVTLANFYKADQPTEIKLRKELSPQKNAEVYYRKAKNQHIEIERLQQSIAVKEKEIQVIKEQIAQVEDTKDLQSFRKITSALGLRVEKEKQKTGVLPYYEFDFSGFKIWVGKNAQSNDRLTLKYGYKEDLWLHAKDVAGSHVLIKYQAGKKFPKEVIERAAELAAFNSKRKNESLCPVVVTPKKFVRKRKGDPPGAVVVEREEVVMVTPRLVIGDR